MKIKAVFHSDIGNRSTLVAGKKFLNNVPRILEVSESEYNTLKKLSAYSWFDILEYPKLFNDGEPVDRLGVDYTNIKTEEDLLKALADASVKNIIITDNITLTKTLSISRPNVSIEGNNNKITVPFADGVNTKDGVQFVNASGSTIKNLVVELTGVEAASWKGAYGIQVFNSTIVLEGVVASGGNAGILVNGSQVTLKGQVDVSKNGFGGIEISVGETNANSKPTLTITKCELTNSTESATNPTVWADGTDKLGHNVIIGGSLYKVENPEGHENQDYFFINKKNAPTKPVSKLKSAKAVEAEEAPVEETVTEPVEEAVVETPVETAVEETAAEETATKSSRAKKK